MGEGKAGGWRESEREMRESARARVSERERERAREREGDACLHDFVCVFGEDEK